MYVPAYVRRASNIIDRIWFAPRRKAKLMAYLGVDDTCTKFDLARKQHRPSKALQGQIQAACNAKLAQESGWEPKHG